MHSFLDAELKKLGKERVIGPTADNAAVIIGNYPPAPPSQYVTTPLDGLRALATTVNYVPGCNDVFCTQYNAAAVKQAAADADIVVVCLGTGSYIEGEGSDRADMELPGNQTALLMDTLYNAKKPIILLLFSAGPLNISVAKSSDMVAAIVSCFFPGQGTGEALRRVLMADADGSVLSPAGRLPYTWPASLSQVPPMTTYSMDGRTYRYFKGPGMPLYPFGYGLSYSNFTYDGLTISPDVVRAGINLTVNVNVANLGPYDSDEVIQVYIAWRDSPVVMPQLQLVAVRRLALKSTQKKTVSLVIKNDQLRIYDDAQGFILHPGVIDVYVGGQQPNQATSASSNVLHGQVTVAGLKSSNTVRQTKTAPKWKPAGFERLPDHL